MEYASEDGKISEMRIRVEYRKEGALIYISHLDLVRVWERLLRRTDLPLRFTEGFNPRVKMDFCPPLPMGVAGENEVMDFYLIKDVELDEISRRVNENTPDGMKINRVRIAPDNSPSLFSLTTHLEIEFFGKTIKDLNLKDLTITRENKKGKKREVELDKLIVLEKNEREGKRIIIKNEGVGLSDIIKFLNEKNCIDKVIRKNLLIDIGGKFVPLFGI